MFSFRPENWGCVVHTSVILNNSWILAFMQKGIRLRLLSRPLHMIKRDIHSYVSILTQMSNVVLVCVNISYVHIYLFHTAYNHTCMFFLLHYFSYYFLAYSVSWGIKTWDWAACFIYYKVHLMSRHVWCLTVTYCCSLVFSGNSPLRKWMDVFVRVLKPIQLFRDVLVGLLTPDLPKLKF